MIATSLQKLRRAKDGLREAEDRWITACQEALPEGTIITWLTTHYSNHHKQHGVIVNPPQYGRVRVRNSRTLKTYDMHISTLLASNLEIIEE